MPHGLEFRISDDISALPQVIAYGIAIAARQIGLSQEVEHTAMRAYLAGRDLVGLLQPVVGAAADLRP